MEVIYILSAFLVLLLLTKFLAGLIKKPKTKIKYEEESDEVRRKAAEKELESLRKIKEEYEKSLKKEDLSIEEKDEKNLEEEEINAVISIKELEKMSKTKEDNEEEEIPISIDELYNTIEIPRINKDNSKDLYDLTDTKEYPLEKCVTDKNIISEKEKNEKILEDELQKTNEFLKNLKELRKNLD